MGSGFRVGVVAVVFVVAWIWALSFSSQHPSRVWCARLRNCACAQRASDSYHIVMKSKTRQRDVELHLDSSLLA